jgi:hypothetical protein
LPTRRTPDSQQIGARRTASQQDAVTLVIRELTAPGGYARTKTRGRLER